MGPLSLDTLEQGGVRPQNMPPSGATAKDSPEPSLDLRKAPEREGNLVSPACLTDRCFRRPAGQGAGDQSSVGRAPDWR